MSDGRAFGTRNFTGRVRQGRHSNASYLDTAERFLTNAEASFNDLARQPLIGALLTLRHPNLAGIRKWRIKDFDHHLILHPPP